MERRYENKRWSDRQPSDQAVNARRRSKQFYRRLIMGVGSLAITVTVLGVLVTPIIMSLVYTWVWMFLYSAYLIIGLVSWALMKGGRCYEDY